MKQSHQIEIETESPVRTVENEATTGKKKFTFQIMIFMLTYASYSLLHFIRQSWSILKPSVEQDDPPGLGWQHNNNLGLVDFAFLFSYSSGLFICGNLSDHLPIRIILPIGFLVV